MNVLILPKEAVKKISNDYVRVEIPENETETVQRKIDWNKVESVCGTIKNVYSASIKYQQKLRREWEERLENQLSRH